jgi:hypothetical protein
MPFEEIKGLQANTVISSAFNSNSAVSFALSTLASGDYVHHVGGARNIDSVALHSAF